MRARLAAALAVIATVLPACRPGGARADSTMAETAVTRAATDSLPSPAAGGPAAQRDTLAARTGSAPSGRPARPDTTSGAVTAVVPRGAPENGAAGPAVPGVRMPTAPGTTPPAPRMVPAYVVFRDTVRASDVDWLRAEGFEIVRVNESSHSVSARMPAGYRGKPTSNPRVLRFSVAMR